MKNSWIIGSVVAGHAVVFSLLLTQGCQTVQSGRRTAMTVPPPEAVPVLSTTPAPAAFAPDGRPIPRAEEVGRPGTFTEVVVPRTPAAPSPVVVTPPVSVPSQPVRPVPEIPAAVATYTVAKGDSLGHIAQRHGVTTRDLIRLNQINEPNRILVGQTLKIPAASRRPSATPAPSVRAPADGTTHAVAAGESVSVIAQKYGVRTADVLSANHLTRDSVIRVGQTLVIPGAKAPVAPAPPPPPAVRASAEQPAPPPPPPAPAPSAPPPQESPAVEEAPSVAAAPSAAEPRYKTYTVKENDDVYSVAISHGLTPSSLRQLNNLTSSELTPGQVLRLPE